MCDASAVHHILKFLTIFCIFLYVGKAYYQNCLHYPVLSLHSGQLRNKEIIFFLSLCSWCALATVFSGTYIRARAPLIEHNCVSQLISNKQNVKLVDDRLVPPFAFYFHLRETSIGRFFNVLHILFYSRKVFVAIDLSC